MSIIQPVHVRYGFKTGDDGQPISVTNRLVGGPPTTVWFSEDTEDPGYHHSNGGGYSIVNGPGSSSGYDAWGDIRLWICDLWAPDPTSRTEFQVWMALADASTGDVVTTFMAEEFYAPLQHDDLLWDEQGNLVHDAPGHSAGVRHTAMHFGPLYVPSNRRLRVQLTQFHDNPTVPGYDKPYPGYIRKATADLGVVPR